MANKSSASKEMVTKLFFVIALLLTDFGICTGQFNDISNSIIEESIRVYSNDFKIDKDQKGLYVVEFVSTVSYDSATDILHLRKLRGTLMVGFVNTKYSFRYPSTMIIQRPKSQPVVVFCGFEPFTYFDQKAMEKFIKSIEKYTEPNPNIAYPRKLYDFINDSVVQKKQ